MKVLNKRILLEAVKAENPLNPDSTEYYQVVGMAEGVTQVKKGDKVHSFQSSGITIKGKEYRLVEEDDLTLILD